VRLCRADFQLVFDMTSARLSRVSALLLAVAGVGLLFAPTTLLRGLNPTFPASASWVGQLAGAAWLGVAALNWLSRSAVLGGIYGRPVVGANLGLYFISALVLIDARMWLVALLPVVLAAIYGWLLIRGPFRGDLNARR
jgi:hypothetical protein